MPSRCVLKGPPASTPTAAYTAHDVTRGGAADEEAFGVGLGVSDAVGDALVVHGDAEALAVGLGDAELDADRLPVVVNGETVVDAVSVGDSDGVWSNVKMLDCVRLGDWLEDIV